MIEISSRHFADPDSTEHAPLTAYCNEHGIWITDSDDDGKTLALKLTPADAARLAAELVEAIKQYGEDIQLVVRDLPAAPKA